MKLSAVSSALLMAALALSAADLQLPDPLTTQAGEKVRSAQVWQSTRRSEILELFRQNVYGRAPVGRPAQLSFQVTETSPGAMDGKATRKLVNISFAGPGGEETVHLILFIPNAVAKPAPCFLLICNRDPTNIDASRKLKSPFWPAEQIVARGYAAAAFYNADVAPDQFDGFTSGVFKIFDPPQGRRPDSWGTIAAWAWGASRVLDYLQTDPDIDGRRVALVGHSRGGKTALWAGAEDERFAMVVSNDSGCTGAGLARCKDPGAETVEVINSARPHWFCANYKRYNHHESELPVDQHELAALIAPRLLYIASASADKEADPGREFLCALFASPVYQLFGCTGVAATQLPPPQHPVHQGRIGYHQRAGKHDLTEYDWSCFMDFAAHHLLATGATELQSKKTANERE